MIKFNLTEDKIEKMEHVKVTNYLEKVISVLDKNFPKNTPYCTVKFGGNMQDAFTVVWFIQVLYPGWRFSLIGGDTKMGYKIKKGGGYVKRGKDRKIVVDTKSKNIFGWKAEFFGDANPKKDTGQRHGVAWGHSPCSAIHRASLKALIKEMGKCKKKRVRLVAKK